MATVAIIAFVVLVIGVPALLINRDLITGKGRRRRQRRESSLPFLFFPTTGPSANPPPVPAWPARRAEQVQQVQPNLPLQPEPGIADLPQSELSYRSERDRTVPLKPADDARLGVRD